MRTRRFLPYSIVRYGKKPYGRIIDILPSGKIKILTQFGKILICSFANLYHRVYKSPRKFTEVPVFPKIGDYGTYSSRFGNTVFFPYPWEHLNY